MPPQDHRYHRADRTFGTVVVALVGLGLTLGGSMLAIGAALDLWALESAEPARVLRTLSGLVVAVVVLVPGLIMTLGLGLQLRDDLASAPSVRAPLSRVRLAMPLSTGASAVGMFGGPMLALHLLAFGPLFFLTLLPGWMAVPIGLVVSLWFFAVVGLALEAWTQRASDLLIGDEGLAIRGGPLGGLRHDWAELAEAGARCQRHEEGAAEHSTLFIGSEVVARCTDAEEGRSLGAISETIRALASPELGSAVVRGNAVLASCVM